MRQTRQARAKKKGMPLARTMMRKARQVSDKTRHKSEQGTKGSLPALAAGLGGSRRAPRHSPSRIAFLVLVASAVATAPAAGAHDDASGKTSIGQDSTKSEQGTKGCLPAPAASLGGAPLAGGLAAPAAVRTAPAAGALDDASASSGMTRLDTNRSKEQRAAYPPLPEELRALLDEVAPRPRPPSPPRLQLARTMHSVTYIRQSSIE